MFMDVRARAAQCGGVEVLTSLTAQFHEARSRTDGARVPFKEWGDLDLISAKERINGVVEVREEELEPKNCRLYCAIQTAPREGEPGTVLLDAGGCAYSS